MRLRSDLWVRAYLRRCSSAGAMALVARRGDPERGAIFVRTQRPDHTSVVFGPAPSDGDGKDRRFLALLGPDPVPDAKVDALLARQASFDEDIWIIDVDDTAGRHFLDDELAS